MFEPGVVGTTHSRESTVLICKKCGFQIGDTGGGCDYNCVYDFDVADLRPTGTVVRRVYRVNETLLSEEPYVPIATTFDELEP